MSSGHDEYWSGQQRANVETARDAGVNLAFFSGNESFWKTRWEPSIDGSSTSYRTLVCYKETAANAKIDPSTEWTGTWRDPRFSPPADGGRPENALTGTLYRVNATRERHDPGPRGRRQDAPLAQHERRHAPGDGVATLTTGSLGYEWDEAPDVPSRPPGSFNLSTTTLAITDGKYLLDNGLTYGNGTATHHLTMYRAPSGALVFGAGTVQWVWGLDTENLHGGSVPDVRMQQATVNLLADLGAQPTTLMAGVVAATASSDRTAPTSTISAPADGAALIPGTPVVISGTATDAGGGRVGGVDVSTDNGVTWHPAVGREQWTYAWTPSALGATTILARAVDDSANQQPTPTAAQVSLSQIRPGLASVPEGNDGTTVLQVPVTLSNPSLQPVTVQWATPTTPGAPAGQADPTIDYLPASGTLTFAPGETTKTVDITVLGDTAVEPDEYVFVQFTNPTNASLGGFLGYGFGVITNDD